MNQPPPPTPLLTALERLVSASGVREVVEAIGDWCDLGLCDGIALWRLDAERDTLRVAGSRGVDEELLAAWRAGSRRAVSPLWGVLVRREAHALDLASMPLALAAALRGAKADHWLAVPLFGPEGEELGAAVAGFREVPAPALPWEAAGAALSRAMAFDHARWRGTWFDALAKLTNDGVILATSDGDVLAYNRALQQHTGWSLDDVRTHGWTHLVYPDPEVRSDLLRAIAALVQGQPSRGVVRPMTRKDGTTVQTSVWSHVLPNPTGEAPGLLGVMRDVSAEQARERARARDESLTRLGRLAGGVAHEFNNLLGAIMGHAELLQASSDHPVVQRRASTILTSSQRGAKLSRQLLAFSGTTRFQTRSMSPTALIRDAVELVRPAARDEVTLELTTDASLAAIEADAPQLQHALTNLLTNAEQAATHHVTIDVRAAVLPADVSFRAHNTAPPGTGMCRIRIHDDGDGFTPDALAHLFEPFFTSRPGGHGLGLPAVRGIIGTHRGAIHIHNRVGAIVDVYLAFSDRPELTLRRPQEGDTDVGTGTVWLIDDETALLEFSRISLEVQGYSVGAFASSQAALDAVDTAPALPDLLVVDVVMPTMNGPELVAALQSRGVMCPVLYTSGYSPEEADMGGDPSGFLQKPFTGAELGGAVRRALARAR